MPKIQIDEELFDEMAATLRKSEFVGKFEGAHGMIRFCWSCQGQWYPGRVGDGVPNHKSGCRLKAILDRTRVVSIMGGVNASSPDK